MHKIVMGILVSTFIAHASNNSPRWSGSCLTAEEEESREVILAIRAERDRLRKEIELLQAAKNLLETNNQQLHATIQVLQQELQDAHKPNK